MISVKRYHFVSEHIVCRESWGDEDVGKKDDDGVDETENSREHKEARWRRHVVMLELDLLLVSRGAVAANWNEHSIVFETKQNAAGQRKQGDRKTLVIQIWLQNDAWGLNKD